MYETSKPRKQTEKMSKQINRWRVPRVYKKKTLKCLESLMDHTQKNQLGPATSNADIFLQE